jgi:hypothetical protein
MDGVARWQEAFLARAGTQSAASEAKGRFWFKKNLTLRADNNRLTIVGCFAV